MKLFFVIYVSVFFIFGEVQYIYVSFVLYMNCEEITNTPEINDRILREVSNTK
ncbi:hypothetical protein HMPREF0765_2848 [Sphingobacterium spiritivorum ATCC 33300]|uniref:Uncharacterized protein n=1 Tax=Sphingobacterium spiritivorum ATCC 33300 TaxID=525372 RepID=C2FZU2_SPHSI|nr:hypothetical protein HMPREF0765_2848 [Sphingobacterium spiritivorum ATCC 33300]